MRVALFLAFLFACLGAVSFFLKDTKNDSYRSIASIDTENVMETYKSRITATANSPSAIDYMVDRNPLAFGCMFSESGDCESKRRKGDLVLVFEKLDAAASALTQIPPNQGLTWAGLGCTEFPSPECALRIEAEWTPICAPQRCELTRSFRLRFRLLKQMDASEVPEEWVYENMHTPSLKLSAAVTCTREGGRYTGLSCSQGEEPLPSMDESLPAPVPPAPGTEPDLASRQEESQFHCPPSIKIQDVDYEVPDLGLPTTQIVTRTVTGCNGEGMDTYTFQCVAKVPAESEGEGQWVQIAANLAPACMADGSVPVEGELGEYSDPIPAQTTVPSNINSPPPMDQSQYPSPPQGPSDNQRLTEDPL